MLTLLPVTVREIGGFPLAKPKHNGPAGAVQLFKDARIRIEPMRKLSAEALDAFHSIIACREAASWTPYDIAQATSLAEMVVQRDRLQNHVMANGAVTENRFGEPVVSAQAQALDRLSRTVLAVSRSIGVTARREDAQTRARAQRENAVRARHDRDDDADSLLA